jgi:MFS family permease
MIAVLRQRDFSLLWFGGVLSVVGDFFLFIALPFFVYERTGSALATGAMFAAETLPRLLFGSVAGVFVDRWDRKKTMVVADLARAAILLPLLAVAAGGPVWIVYVVAFAEATVSMFFLPAKGALVPKLVEERHLAPANSLNSMGEQVPSLVGPLLGGALFGLVGLGGLVVLDIATYLGSAALISLISLRSVTASDRPSEEAGETARLTAAAWTGALREWLEGLRLVGRDLRVAAVFAVVAVAMVGEGVITVLIVVFVKDVLGGGSAEFSWIITAYGAGGIAGGFLAAGLASAVGEARLLALSAATNGIFLLLMFNIPVLTVVVALGVPAGATVVGWFVGAQTLLQRWVPDSHRGRVFGTYETTQALLLLVGMGFAAVLAAPLGVVAVLSFVGAVYVVVGAIAWATLPKRQITDSPKV